jgi:hypothetical protein
MIALVIIVPLTLFGYTVGWRMITFIALTNP